MSPAVVRSCPALRANFDRRVGARHPMSMRRSLAASLFARDVHHSTIGPLSRPISIRKAEAVRNRSVVAATGIAVVLLVSTGCSSSAERPPPLRHRPPQPPRRHGVAAGREQRGSRRQRSHRGRLPAFRHRLLELLHQLRAQVREFARRHDQDHQLAERRAEADRQHAGAAGPGRQGDRDGAAGHCGDRAGTVGSERQEDPGRDDRHPARHRQRLHGRAGRQQGVRDEGVPVPRQLDEGLRVGRHARGRHRVDQRPRSHRCLRQLHEEQVPEDHRARASRRSGTARRRPTSCRRR